MKYKQVGKVLRKILTGTKYREYQKLAIIEKKACEE